MFPSPEERARIVSRRLKLAEQLIADSFQHPGDFFRLERLARKYGPDEMLVVVNIVTERFSNVVFLGDDVAGYRSYRLAFARFGDDRPFLSVREYNERTAEYARLSGQRAFRRLRSRPSARERELDDLLLSQMEYWQDIAPPAVPPRPASYPALTPDPYGYPARALLKWGPDLDEQRIAENARNAKWRPAIPELVQMVLDRGLLDGWPGEAASWAPYHALSMLGHLHAHREAGHLLALLDQENDWLSDRLPPTWARMGPLAEPPLWDYLAHSQHPPYCRGIVLLGLAAIAEQHLGRRLETVRRLADLLQQAPAGDAEANSYIVHVLDRLQGIEVRAAIIAAFREGKVDLEIICPEDVGFL
jgi:hypothetical protein